MYTYFIEVADCEVISIYLDHCYSSRVIADRLEPIAIENNITIPASEMSHAKQSPRTTKGNIRITLPNTIYIPSYYYSISNSSSCK